jgi:hypothetical protein
MKKAGGTGEYMAKQDCSQRSTILQLLLQAYSEANSYDDIIGDPNFPDPKMQAELTASKPAALQTIRNLERQLDEHEQSCPNCQ